MLYLGKILKYITKHNLSNKIQQNILLKMDSSLRFKIHIKKVPIRKINRIDK